jgi:hypothetical protein
MSIIRRRSLLDKKNTNQQHEPQKKKKIDPDLRLSTAGHISCLSMQLCSISDN